MAQPTKPDKKVTVTFSVNGQQITDDYPENQPIKAGAKKVLEKTGNSSDLDRWNLTNGGEAVDFNTTFAEAGIVDGDVLVLSNKPGTKA